MTRVSAKSGSESDTLTKHKRALPALTGIRFLAAFYVVLFHSLPWALRHFSFPQPMRIFLGNGYLAVALFFILSGFILAYTYEGQIEGASVRSRFWQARFARIYPVYVLSLALVYSFQCQLPFLSKVAVLAMVQAWNPLNPGLAGAWNYPAWSLSVEAFFYLIFPFVLPWMSRRRKNTLAIQLGICLAAGTLLRTPLQGLASWKPWPSLQIVPLPVLRLPEFLAGMILGLWLLRREPQHSSRMRWARIAVAVIATVFLLCLPVGSWVSLIVFPFAVMVYELAAEPSWLARLLSTKAMVLLGGASYCVYLLQYPVRSWVHVIFDRVPARFASLGAPITPLVLVLFSIAVFLFWEEPGRRGLRRWFSRIRAGRQTCETLD